MKKLFSRLACVLTLGLWALAQQGPTFTIENPNQGKQHVRITRPGSAPEFVPQESNQKDRDRGTGGSEFGRN